MKLLSLLIGLLSVIQCRAVPGYDMTTFTNDGLGNPLIFPQMTAFSINQSIIIFHYGVDGVFGQSGLTIISPTNQYIKSITNITQSITGVNPPGNFVRDSYYADFPSWANYMRTYEITESINQSINQTIEVIEFIMPFSPVGLVIDFNGRFIRSFPKNQTVQSTLPYQSTNLTVRRNDNTKSIIIGGDNQPMKKVINLLNYWQMSSGRAAFIADPVILTINQSINQYRLIVFVDDSPLAYPYLNQALLVIDPMTGELLNVLHEGIWSDIGQLPVIADSAISVTHPSINQSMNSSFMVRGPLIRDQGAVYMYTLNQSVNRSKPSLHAGDVSNVFFAGLGPLQGQAVFTQSINQSINQTITCTSVMSPFSVLVPQFTRSIICFDQSINPLTNQPINQPINQFTNITGLTATALSQGASSNLNDYLIVAMIGQSINQSINHLYMSFITPSNRATGVPSGVLITSQSGEFVDLYLGFDWPQTPFFTRSNELAVPDRGTNQLVLIDLLFRSVIMIRCNGCSGGCVDHVNGGYIVAIHTTGARPSASLQFWTQDWIRNTAIQPITYLPPSMGDHAPLSNPVQDQQGRLYVVVKSGNGQATPTGQLYVYHSINQSIINQHDFANPQPRGFRGIAQYMIASTISLDPINQLIVVTTNDFGQIFRTVSYGKRSEAQLSSSSSSTGLPSSSTGFPSSSTGLPSSSSGLPSSSTGLPSSSSGLPSSSSGLPSSSPGFPSSSSSGLPSSSTGLPSSSTDLPSSSSGLPSSSSGLPSSSSGLPSSSPGLPSSSSGLPSSSSGLPSSSSGLPSSSTGLPSSSSGLPSSSSTGLPSSSPGFPSSSSDLPSSSTGLTDPIPITDDSSNSSSLSSGELAAAIVVPVVVSIAILIAALLYFCRPTSPAAASKAPPAVAPEIDRTVDDHAVNMVEMEHM